MESTQGLFVYSKLSNVDALITEEPFDEVATANFELVTFVAGEINYETDFEDRCNRFLASKKMVDVYVGDPPSTSYGGGNRSKWKDSTNNTDE